MFKKIKPLWKSELKDNIVDIESTIPYYEPYENEGNNLIYNLLFCDNRELLNGESREINKALTDPIFADEFDLKALEEIVSSEGIESRVKQLAYNKMREHHVEIPKKILLGVVIEVALERGLDVLASFLDGEVRYISHSEKLVMVNTPLDKKIKYVRTDDNIEIKYSKDIDETSIFEPYVHSIFMESEKILTQMGVWEHERLSPPTLGNMRFTFVCSDGLYFAQSTIEVCENDENIKSLFQSSIGLLTVVTKTAP